MNRHWARGVGLALSVIAMVAAGGGMSLARAQTVPSPGVAWDGLGAPPEQQERVPTAKPRPLPQRPPHPPANTPDVTSSTPSAASTKAFTPEWWAREKADDDRLNKKLGICHNC